MTDGEGAPGIEGYRIVGLLGRGAMGSVWRAVDRVGRTVAVKVPDRARRLPGAQREELFRREALVTLNLRHPSLVRGLEVGETTDGRPFLSMELVAGETLGQRMTSGPVPEVELLRIGHALASGLERAHALGLVHRDIKPDNVMLLPDGSVRLVDFSLVSEAGSEGSRCGTPGFASPEMILEHPVGPASDLYSLGITLASAAQGRPCFRGADVKAVLRRNVRDELTLPEVVDGRPLSEGFRAVLLRLGRKRPSERHGSAGEVRLDFEALLHGERPFGAYLGLARLGKRGRSRAVLAGAAVALLAVVAVLWAMRGTDSPSSSTAVVSSPPPSGSRPPSSDLSRDDASSAVLAASEESTRRDREARTAADAELERWREAARAAADAGSTEPLDRLPAWPAALAGRPQEREARNLTDEVRTRLRAPAESTLAAAREALARSPGPADDCSELRRSLAGLERLLSGPSLPSDQRRRGDEAIVLVRKELAACEARVAGRASRQGLAAYAEAAGRRDAGAVARAVAALGQDAAAPDVSAAARDVGARARTVDAVLSRHLAALASRPWAGIVDGALVVGNHAPPPPARFFLPLPPSLGPETGAGGDLGDLRALEPDPDRLASWLIVSGVPDAARTVAAAGSAARRFLDAVDPLLGAASTAESPFGRELRTRSEFVLRAPGGAAPTEGVAEHAVLAAWARFVTAARTKARVPAHATTSDALEEARRAFVADDWGRSWDALGQAATATPDDPEVAILRCRVLEGASKELRTFGISLLALSEARRAYDLDPLLSASVRLLAEQSLRFLARHPGPFADAVARNVPTWCLEADRIGQATAPMLVHVADAWTAAGKAADALPLLRRAGRLAPGDASVALSIARAAHATGDADLARTSLVAARARLGDEMPRWATEMLARLPAR